MLANRVLAMTSAALVLLSVAGLPAGAQHQHPQRDRHPAAQEVKVGKSDDVSFAKEVRVGEVTLKPGKYRLQHRADGADHFVHFKALATTTPSAHKTATGVAVPAGAAGEVKCRVEPLEGKASETTLHLLNEEGGQRLTKVLIRGENVAHVF